MAWKTIAAALTVILAIILIQQAAVGPLVEIIDGVQESGDYNTEHFNGDQLMDGMVSAWLTGGLVGIFGIMVWALYRLLRYEVTRQGGGGLQ